jgi:hypothetical protein
MEPRKEEKPGQQPRPETEPAKPRRFRIVKLEDRVAPCKLNYSYGIPCDCRTLHPGQCK